MGAQRGEVVHCLRLTPRSQETCAHIRPGKYPADKSVWGFALDKIRALQRVNGEIITRIEEKAKVIKGYEYLAPPV